MNELHNDRFLYRQKAFRRLFQCRVVYVIKIHVCQTIEAIIIITFLFKHASLTKRWKTKFLSFNICSHPKTASHQHPRTALLCS